MNVSLPILISSEVREGRKEYLGRPLLFSWPAKRDFQLERLVAALQRDLTLALNKQAREESHGALAERLFAPDLRTEKVNLTLTLRRSQPKVRHLLVGFEKFSRWLVSAPLSGCELWWECRRGEKWADRATEVLTAHYRKLEGDDETCDPVGESMRVGAWVENLDLALTLQSKVKKPDPLKFLGLGGADKKNGETELFAVGRCLDWLHPDGLDRPARRDREVEELVRLLAEEPPRPVLLLGPRGAGKTAVVHGAVRRRVEARPAKMKHKNQAWYLSPARLIAGMSFVGEWEDRVLAIMRFARKRDHVLYFDDLVGLFLAGISASSSLTVANLLAPAMGRGEVRMLAEATPGEWRAVRERDRGFADLFHVVPIDAPAGDDGLFMALAAAREVEARNKAEFDPDEVPEAIELARRYDRVSAMPGTAMPLVRAMANLERDPGGDYSRPLLALAETTGVQVDFFAASDKWPREALLRQIEYHLVGQPDAVAAVLDMLLLAKAGLNDRSRPLGSFLFLGPTGVGKTEMAKTLAKVAFGEDQNKLIRFDMNEYGEPGSSARLIGTPGRPDGLLTEAIRRQPFALVLFDEVEKADPETFDLLLQVLGEARLSDARGRTADFSNAFVVLTSNLGVREAESHVGFTGRSAASSAESYREAAKRFFRPEFFNRIDRVVPFRRLLAEDVLKVAQRVVNGVMKRDGLARRNCILSIDPELVERVARAGYDPAYGARSMKRAVEDKIVRPLAAELAARPPAGYTDVHLAPKPGDPAEALVSVHPLLSAKVLPPVAAPGEFTPALIAEYRDTISQIQDQYETLRPSGAISKQSLLRPEDARQISTFYELSEKARGLRASLDDWAGRIEEDRMLGQSSAARSGSKAGNPGKMERTKSNWNTHLPQSTVRDMRASRSVEQLVSEWVGYAPFEAGGTVEKFERDLGLLGRMSDAADEFMRLPSPCLSVRTARAGSRPVTTRLKLTRVVMQIYPFAEFIEVMRTLEHVVHSIKSLEEYALSGTAVGTHLLIDSGSFGVVTADLFGTREAADAQPGRPGPIVRIYDVGRQSGADLRTNETFPLETGYRGREPDGEAWRALAGEAIRREEYGDRGEGEE